MLFKRFMILRPLGWRRRCQFFRFYCRRLILRLGGWGPGVGWAAFAGYFKSCLSLPRWAIASLFFVQFVGIFARHFGSRYPNNGLGNSKQAADVVRLWGRSLWSDGWSEQRVNHLTEVLMSRWAWDMRGHTSPCLSYNGKHVVLPCGMECHHWLKISTFILNWIPPSNWLAKTTTLHACFKKLTCRFLASKFKEFGRLLREHTDTWKPRSDSIQYWFHQMDSVTT